MEMLPHIIDFIKAIISLITGENAVLSLLVLIVCGQMFAIRWIWQKYDSLRNETSDTISKLNTQVKELNDDYSNANNRTADILSKIGETMNRLADLVSKK